MKILLILISYIFISISYGREIDVKECGKTKGCFFDPQDCKDEKSCKKLITWRSEGDSIHFEMMGKKPYIAIGFSNNKQMADTSILACVFQNEMYKNETVQMYYAKGIGRQNVKRKPKEGITSEVFQGSQNHYRCRFSRLKKYQDPELYDLSKGKTYYLLTAAGKTKYRGIRDHESDKAATNNKYDLTLKSTNRNNSNKVNANLISITISIVLAFLFINQF